MQGAIGINAPARVPRNNRAQPQRGSGMPNWREATAMAVDSLHGRLITALHEPHNARLARDYTLQLLQCAPRFKKMPRVAIGTSAWQNKLLAQVPARGKTFSGSATTGHALTSIKKPGLRSLTTAGPGEEQPLITTDELYGIGPLPKQALDRRRYLSDPNHWVPERRALHNKLIADAIPKALKFAEAVRESGEEPAIYALRGNTAVGKTRMAATAIPVLASALNKSGGGSVNPDVFKPPLRLKEGGKLTSTQVHVESHVLSDRLEAQLRPLKTAGNAPASILVDKRLARTGEIEHYAGMARETGRKIVLCDIDAPLEKSLVGVLERHPDDNDPLPPYHAVGNGFSAVRANRAAVIDKFIADPSLGSYQLYGTSPDGRKIKVASVEHGELVIDHPELYAELTMAPGDLPARLSENIIDGPLIAALTKDLDSERAESARSALAAYSGMTWRQALDAHSAKSE